MEQAQDHYYQAMASRDRRFDGRFFTAVHTTGIYCRPICPARTPLRKNVTFYACAAAAEQAGFRRIRWIEATRQGWSKGNGACDESMKLRQSSAKFRLFGTGSTGAFKPDAE